MATEIVLHQIEVRKNGSRFGRLWIGKKAIQWMPLNSKKNWGDITWEDFDRLMKRHGRST